MPGKQINERDTRVLLSELAASLFARGFSVGSAGNISARLDDGWLITPTDASLGRLEEVNPWYWGNQTLTRERLESF